ncbi:MAG: hypothetical protein R3C56_28905 [Pirellulaceae bacterium]
MHFGDQLAEQVHLKKSAVWCWARPSSLAEPAQAAIRGTIDVKNPVAPGGGDAVLLPGGNRCRMFRGDHQAAIRFL